jgi:hypothetical protein
MCTDNIMQVNKNSGIGGGAVWSWVAGLALWSPQAVLILGCRDDYGKVMFLGVGRGMLTKAYVDNSKIGATDDRQETDQELWQQLRGGNLLYWELRGAPW